jgi:hypothetical protein
VEIRDLNDRGMLGASGAAGTSEIWLDDDALGYGWSFTDEADGDVPAGTVDLATVMAHEYGHLLGWQDLDPEQYSGHLMAGELAVGERRGVETLFVQGRLQDVDAAEMVPQQGTSRVDLFGTSKTVAIASQPWEDREVSVAESGAPEPTKDGVRPTDAEPALELRDNDNRALGSDQRLGEDLSLLDDLFADFGELL